MLRRSARVGTDPHEVVISQVVEAVGRLAGAEADLKPRDVVRGRRHRRRRRRRNLSCVKSVAHSGVAIRGRLRTLSNVVVLILSCRLTFNLTEKAIDQEQEGQHPRPTGTSIARSGSGPFN